MADLGGGGTPGPCPPFWNQQNKNKKHKCVGPPPPRLWLARLSTLVALRKKVSEPPPPPRSSAFLGLARLSRLAAVKNTPSVLCPPLFINPGSAPDFKNTCTIHLWEQNLVTLTCLKIWLFWWMMIVICFKSVDQLRGTWYLEIPPPPKKKKKKNRLLAQGLSLNTNNYTFIAHTHVLRIVTYT